MLHYTAEKAREGQRPLFQNEGERVERVAREVLVEMPSRAGLLLTAVAALSGASRTPLAPSASLRASSSRCWSFEIAP